MTPAELLEALKAMTHAERLELAELIAGLPPSAGTATVAVTVTRPLLAAGTIHDLARSAMTPEQQDVFDRMSDHDMPVLNPDPEPKLKPE